MHSARYRIAQYLRTVLEAVATAQSAVLVINPALPVGVKDKGPRVLFLLDRGEELIDQPGQQEKRRGKFVVGALARGDDDADTLHFAARLAFRGSGFRPGLSTAAKDARGEGGAPIFREVEVDPALKDVPVDGALLLSAFNVEYYETYFAA